MYNIGHSAQPSDFYMVKNLLLLALAGFVTTGAFSPNAFAQERPPVRTTTAYSSTVQANIGFSTVGFFASLANHASVIANVEVNSHPAWQGSYLYHPVPRVGVGVGISHQAFSIRYRDYQYESNGTTLLDNFTTRIKRLNIAALGLFYYTNTESLSLYSGLRLGITRWSFDTNAEDINYTVGKFLKFALGTQFAPQIILIGVQSYFTPHWGMNGEIAIGAPHLFSLGASFRW